MLNIKYMSHSTILLAFYVSLILILPIGLFLMVHWAKRIFKPIAKGIDESKHINLNGIAFKTFIYMIPGIIVLGIFAAPALYFNHLIKKEDYCVEVIRFNRIKEPDADLKERCSCLNMDELFIKAGKK